MPMIQIIILAVVQGFTEFLPISSTAHLYLSSWLLGWQTESLQFDLMLHVGTLLAVVLYFYRDWIEIVGKAFGLGSAGKQANARERNLLWWIAAAAVPIGVVGLLFNKQAEGAWRNPFVMGFMLVAIGVVMGLAERSGRRNRDWNALSLHDSLAIGAAQALAVVPGCSRSGITISAGLFRGLDREAAARFSFLLSTPTIGAAAAKAIWDLHKQHMVHTLVSADVLVGVAVSAAVGCAVIAWFLRFLRNGSLRFFVYYRVIFGIIVLALAFIRRPA